MKPVYFISDIHAGIRKDPDDSARLDAFRQVLNKALDEASELILLGDVFDFWFEWKDVIPGRHLEWLCALKEATDAGLPISIFPGNHDFRLGGILEQQVGLQHPGEFQRRTFEGRQFLLHHGDGLDPTERGYLLLKSMLRSSWAHTLFGWLHPDLGMRLADWAGAGDREHTWNEQQLTEYLKRALPGTLNDKDAALVMGHVHVAGAFKWQGRHIWTLPPFAHKARGYGVLEGEMLRFEYLDSSVATQTLEVSLD